MRSAAAAKTKAKTIKKPRAKKAAFVVVAKPAKLAKKRARKPAAKKAAPAKKAVK